MRRARGFTLIELMVVVAVIAVILMIAAPSFRDTILMQRLRGVNGELVTNLAFARSEAVARNELVGVKFGSDSARTCYVIAAYRGEWRTAFASATTIDVDCDCTLGAGASCAAPWQEVRTVAVAKDLSVQVTAPAATQFAYDPVAGNLRYTIINMMSPVVSPFVVNAATDTRGKLRTVINIAGRSSVCTPDGSVSGTETCPP